MPHAYKPPRDESSTYGGEVHHDKPFTADEWLSMTAAALDRATLASKVSGGPHADAHAWWASRDDARAAENTVVANLVAAHARLAAADALAGRYVDARVPCPSQAATILEGMGYCWTDQHGWLAPAPRGVLDAPLDVTVSVGRNSGTVFRPGVPVRALVEHLEQLANKLERVQSAHTAADDVLTTILSGVAVSNEAMCAARNGLRQE